MNFDEKGPLTLSKPQADLSYGKIVGSGIQTQKEHHESKSFNILIHPTASNSIAA